MSMYDYTSLFLDSNKGFLGSNIDTNNLIISKTLILFLIFSKLAFKIKTYTMTKSTKTNFYTGNTNDINVITVLTIS